MINKVNCLVVLTNETKKQLSSLIRNIPIVVIPNAADPQLLSKHKEVFRDSNRLLYLGWYIPEKGIFDLVEAFKIINKKGYSIKLECYGTKQIIKLKSRVEMNNLENSISVNGWADDIKKVELLRSCTALVLPSYSEGVPNVILEAMAAKIPIISTSVGGLKEILIDRQNAIIIKAGDIDNIANEIIACMKDDKLRQIVSDNAYKDVIHKHSISVIKKQFNTIVSTYLLN